MKKVLSVLLAIVLIISLFPAGIFSITASAVSGNTVDFAGGSGTGAAPYLIETKEHLNNVRKNLNAHYKLIADIAFSDIDFAEGGEFYNNGQGWIPIGENKENSFTGVFDGNGFNIENLKINLLLKSDAYIGLFGYSKGEIKNVDIIASDYVVDASNKDVCVGAIVGCSESDIFNCHSGGKIYVKSTSPKANTIVAGGIVGDISANKSVTINNCSNDCDITVIRNVTSTATSGSIATTSAGGIIGRANSCITVFNCNNAGNIYTTYNGGKLVDIVSGGIIGTSHSKTSILDSCYNSGNITAYSPDTNDIINTFAGGISGENYSVEIKKCYNSGKIFSNDVSGGIFADTTSSVESKITDCFNTGNIFSEFSAGGIGGSTEAIISNCYNIGFIETSIYECYGGIVGFNNGGRATVTNCYYWDIVDKGMGNWDDNTIKCSISELKKSTTYQGFDFGSDWIQSSNPNYCFPVLKGVEFIFKKEVSIIKIKELPKKLMYLNYQEKLDVTGGEIYLYYNNGDIVSIVLENNMVTGFDNTKLGKQTLAVTYEGGICNYDVEVIPNNLDSIAVTTLPSKLNYLECKDKLNVLGGKITVYYNDGKEEVYNLTSDMVSGFDNTVVGNQTLTVTYFGLSDVFDVTIEPKSIESIELISNPFKMVYQVDRDDLFLDGGRIAIYYNNDTSETISVLKSMVTGFDNTKVGEQVLTINHGGKTVTFTIRIIDAVLGDINGDEKVDVVDLAFLKKVVAGLIGIGESGILNPDIDGSGSQPDVVDLAILKKMVAGLA